MLVRELGHVSSVTTEEVPFPGSLGRLESELMEKGGNEKKRPGKVEKVEGRVGRYGA